MVGASYLRAPTVLARVNKTRDIAPVAMNAENLGRRVESDSAQGIAFEPYRTAKELLLAESLGAGQT